MFYRPNPQIDFHQISRTCVSQKDLKKRSRADYQVSGKNCYYGITKALPISMVFRLWVLHKVNPFLCFLRNVQYVLTANKSTPNLVLEISGNNYCYGNTFNAHPCAGVPACCGLLFFLSTVSSIILGFSVISILLWNHLVQTSKDSSKIYKKRNVYGNHLQSKNDNLTAKRVDKVLKVTIYHCLNSDRGLPL